MTKTSLFQIGALVAVAMAATTAQAGGLNLVVDGLRNANGAVVVLVFDDEAAFEQLDYRNAIDYAMIDARPGQVTHSFPQLTTGPYAIFVYHDENGDMDVNFEGQRLLEGIGASGAPTATSYPGFDEAAVPPGDVTVRVFYDQ